MWGESVEANSALGTSSDLTIHSGSTNSASTTRALEKCLKNWFLLRSVPILAVNYSKFLTMTVSWVEMQKISLFFIIKKTHTEAQVQRWSNSMTLKIDAQIQWYTIHLCSNLVVFWSTCVHCWKTPDTMHLEVTALKKEKIRWKNFQGDEIESKRFYEA